MVSRRARASALDVSERVAACTRALAALGSPARADAEKRYHRSTLRFLGCGVPAVRAHARVLDGDLGPLPVDGLRGLVDALFATGVHELRGLGIALLERRAAGLPADELPWLLSLVRASPYWAHVDWLAIKVVGPVWRAAPRRRALARAWAADDDLWVRRTALLCHLDDLKAGGDFEPFAALAAPLLVEREFFIRKAIGWVLREVGRKRPSLVASFVREHGDAMSGLTRREATRHLPTSP